MKYSKFFPVMALALSLSLEAGVALAASPAVTDQGVSAELTKSNVKPASSLFEMSEVGGSGTLLARDEHCAGACAGVCAGKGSYRERHKKKSKVDMQTGSLKTPAATDGTTNTTTPSDNTQNTTPNNK